MRNTELTRRLRVSETSTPVRLHLPTRDREPRKWAAERVQRTALLIVAVLLAVVLGVVLTSELQQLLARVIAQLP